MYKSVVFPLLRQFDEETIHGRISVLMRLAASSTPLRAALERVFRYESPRLRVQTLGMDFANPLGLAAGFDKNAEVILATRLLGFSHEEVGTVPLLPQPGNPKPRVFRLPEDHALINRMGFNTPGKDVVEQNLRSVNLPKDFLLGINVGANKTSVEAGTAADDYVAVTRSLYAYGDYITINVSSPNTAQLRDLQVKEALEHLVRQVILVRDSMAERKPVLVKIAPDLSYQEIDDILDVALSEGIDGIIATNTTTNRESLVSSFWTEQGGLSGAPLRKRSTDVVRYVFNRVGDRIVIVGVGGVFNWKHVLEKIFAGASLVQVYTGFVYEGPTMPRNVKKGLDNYLEREDISSIQELVGVKA